MVVMLRVWVEINRVSRITVWCVDNVGDVSGVGDVESVYKVNDVKGVSQANDIEDSE